MDGGTAEDPFGTSQLRAGTLRAWQDSPTRFTEDTNSEQDLRVGAYRDRLFVELAQNAADAAAQAGGAGRVRVSLVDGELRFANTGAPLDSRGVASLASLRASGKDSGDTVGRFGVGFAAVLTVSDEPRVLSASGGVEFSAARTREAAGRSGDVPVLRLPWPCDDVPPAGFDTEVRLPLREGVDGRALVAELKRDVVDLLLALPWLAEVDVDGEVWSRHVDQDVVRIGAVRWLVHRGDVVWAVPVDENGVPRPLEEDVLRAPTPTDDALSLPARLIATVPVEPSRRRVLPGDALNRALGEAAGEYVGLVRLLAAEHRFELVPKSGFPKSAVDAELRERVFETLAREPWLATEAGGDVAGRQAKVLDVPDLAPLLKDVVENLLKGAPPDALKAVSVQVVTIEEVLETLTGVSREPQWWHEFYDALAIAVESHALRVERLEGLPVPLSDGRTLPGVRGVLLVEGSDELLDLLSDVDVPGLRLVHPAAAHPLLERLGAKHAGARELLDTDQLRDAVEQSVEDVRSGLDGTVLAGAVLRLVAECGDEAPGWAGALALPTEDGWRRADETVLPGSPLLDVFDEEVFDEDGALAVLDEEFAEDWPAATLVAVGALDSFALVTDDEPHEPDHGLPDEDAWWDAQAKPPVTFTAVRDLDLVADDAWPAALRLLAARPETWHALNGYTTWWIARYALLDGRTPGEWRMPDAQELAGLFDVVPELGLSEELLRTAGVRTTLENLNDAKDLLDRLGDPDREVTPGLAAKVHALIAQSDVDEPPARLRAADGSVADAEDVVVLDVPWVAGAREGAALIVAPEQPERLAELLDVGLASEIRAEVTSEGEYVAWADLGALKLAAGQLGVVVPEGGVLLHETLTVKVDGEEHDVPWWSDGRLHAADSAEGLARAFAWAIGQWPLRYQLAALIDDPSAATLLN